MKVILFGASGMIGQGVLRECLLDPDVTAVLSVSRSAIERQHPKLRNIVQPDLMDLSGIEKELVGFDACFFCLGVSSAGMPDADYYRITYELTLAIARTLARLNPGMTFEYVSGAGTDSTERGRIRWARVKGKTENALLALPFKAAYMFRPGAIQPLHGITSKTGWYRVLYKVGAPVFVVLRAVAPSLVTTTEAMGRAMIEAAKHGAPARIIESDAINRLGGG
jgi:uncharacterized protein YbjT (DUF2867 family)